MAIERSIVRRYLLLSVLAFTLPALSIGLLYDRFTASALEQLLGEKILANLTATANRLNAYLDARRYQLETLANYPGIADFSLADAGAAGDVAALLQVESDSPDLYGILFFDDHGRLLRAVPGQAASGPPYWNDRPFKTAELPVTVLGETEIVGPAPGGDGESSWLLMRLPLHSRQTGRASGSIALHVRLASLTEQLGSTDVAGAAQPLLRTPSGDFNVVGQAAGEHGKVIAGPEIMQGWVPLLEVKPTGLLNAFALERRALLAAVVLGSALTIFLFYRLSWQLRQRIGLLVHGAEAISSGRLDHRIDEHGADEIATVSHAFNAMARKLQEYVERALRSERLAVLGEFASGVAHEVRNPLAAIKTSVQALARREQDPKRAQLLAQMEGEIDRLARVVSDLVDFGRPHPPQPRSVAVGELFRHIAGIIEPEANARGLHFSCQGDLDAGVWVDPDHLFQIVLNLALNAVHATPPQGTVALHAHLADGAVTIEVRDTGCGIPAALLDRVSAPFFTTKTKGVGLGLTISRQLCELNEGRMALESVVGQGTVVRIVLPFARTRHEVDIDHR